MTRVRCLRTALLLIATAALIGCKSKQEGQGPATGAPQNAGDVKSISGQNTAGGVATSPQDKADAEAAAAKVLAQMEAGDFAAMYNAASDGFKKIGSVDQFVAKFQQARQKTGPLKNPQEVSIVTRPDKSQVIIYRLVNDQFVTERRLTFARNKSGQMELAGVNQHDEPKPPQAPRK